MDHVVKTEVQPNGEILIFYVDENGGNQEGIVTTIEHIEHADLQQIPEGYIIKESTNENMNINDQGGKDSWLDEEIKRLLIFYIDNKDTFINGHTKRKHLWTFACKTMLTNKTPSSCDKKLHQLKSQYSKICLNIKKNGSADTSIWPHFDLCSQAFDETQPEEPEQNYDITIVKMDDNVPDDIVTTNQANNDFNSEVDVKYATQTIKNVTRSVDEKVNIMLRMYLKYKNFTPRADNVWDKIGAELGEDGQYWHKRFLNYKQHYIKMIEKQKDSNAPTNWPYFSIFEQIFKNDVAFQSKYATNKTAMKDKKITFAPIHIKPVDWNDAEKTVLVKYYFDCIDEFLDPSLPNKFLWTEIGRLLDKNIDSCKTKYEALKAVHIDRILEGGYDMCSRKPLQILFDSIISKETEVELSQTSNIPDHLEVWTTEKIDQLIQYFYDNLEMFKDPIGHFVCWAVVAKKLDESIHDCRHIWRDLTTLYKGVLEDKKEYPDMQIDWRYIDLFDRIFDYGMDVNLLQGYEKFHNEVVDKTEEDTSVVDSVSPTKRSIGKGDAKQIKILEFYLKHKEKFPTGTRKKQQFWNKLAKQIGISAEQCAHRFRNFKQVYTAYVQREINKPEMPIVWPYYPLCKKVFGYRAVKNKLKNDMKKSKVGNVKEWSSEEITELIKFFKENFTEINANIHDNTKWNSLTRIINKTASSCREKFVDLRKSYRKIKTMINKNPDCKVNWKYFKMIDSAYTGNTYFEPMKVEFLEKDDEEDDYQCIIVMPEDGNLEMAELVGKNEPEGADTNTLETAGNIIEPKVEITDMSGIKKEKKYSNRKPWSKLQRIKLLKAYYNYITKHSNKLINSSTMWKDLATEIGGRTDLSCRKMYVSMKINHKKRKENPEAFDKPSPYYSYFEKILAAKPKFVRVPITNEDLVLVERKCYKDIDLPVWRVELALKYYLEHLEEFLHPKYVKKYSWIELSKAVEIPVSKIFRKINYLKQSFNWNIKEPDRPKEFDQLLEQIVKDEAMFNILLETEPKPMMVDEETAWSDIEIEQLLHWYLENLEKFKNPKFLMSYLWLEASKLLNRSPVSCSSTMHDIRTVYSGMVKENPEALHNWRFSDLCQRIYGTGKK